jgi:hypothetical protein
MALLNRGWWNGIFFAMAVRANYALDSDSSVSGTFNFFALASVADYWKYWRVTILLLPDFGPFKRGPVEVFLLC